MAILTKQDIEKVYDEFERRIRIDVRDGDIPAREDCIREEMITRLQGIYGTIMAIVPTSNWRDIVWWIKDIEDQRYGERGVVSL